MKRKMIITMVILCMLLSMGFTASEKSLLATARVGAATSNITLINNMAKPGTLQLGKVFVLKGTINSALAIKRVEVGVAKADGKSWVSGYPVNRYPNTKSFNIASVDGNVKFGKLAAGNYFYRIIVWDENGAHRVLDHKFVVTPFSLSGVTSPATLTKGSSFVVRGRVNSTYKMTSLEIGVVSSAGKWVTAAYAKVNPNATSYDLFKVDSKLKFGMLVSGTYYYRIIVKDAQGNFRTPLNKQFKVVNLSIPSIPRDKFIAKAQGEVGKTSGTRYGTSGAWCAAFTSWCAKESGVNNDKNLPSPKYTWVPDYRDWAIKKGKYHHISSVMPTKAPPKGYAYKRDVNYTPKAGDLVIFGWCRNGEKNQGQACHIAIVYKVTGGKISTIGGNESGSVKKRENRCGINDIEIAGYISAF